MVIKIEELDTAPEGGGARAVWKKDEVKATIQSMVKKAKNGGKKIFGIPVKEAWEEWHGGEVTKYSNFYLRKKVMDILDELGVSGYSVYSTTSGGKSRVIVNLSKAKMP